MKIDFRFSIATIALLIAPLIPVLAQDNAEAGFKQICASCHTIGKGKLVGPDLANVHTRRPEEWIKNFVRSSQTVIKSGDKYADSLFQAFNKVIMPDQPTLTDGQIKNILAYIKENSSAPATTAIDSTPLSGDAQKGQALFVGNIRFFNNGPTCNSCHNVNMKGFVSGGALAKDLTQAVTRLSSNGVKGMMSGLPFPQMKQSYGAKPLTGKEIADITAFLERADELAATQPISNVGKKMLLGGITGGVALLFLFSFFWVKRKRRTVNYAIYKRQLKST